MPLFLSTPLASLSVQTGGSWLRASHLPNFGVSSLFWRQRGICCVLCWSQNFTPSIFSAEEERGQRKSCTTAPRVQGHLSFWAFLAGQVKPLFIAIRVNSQLTTSALLGRAQILFLSSHLLETHLRFSSLYLSKKKIVHYNQPSFTFLPWKGVHRSVLSMCKYNRNVTKLNFL